MNYNLFPYVIGNSILRQKRHGINEEKMHIQEKTPKKREKRLPEIEDLQEIEN